MDSDSIHQSVRAFGVSKTADRVLDRYEAQLTPEGEGFFLGHWQELDGWQLHRWLTRELPDGGEPRPSGLAAKLVTWLATTAFVHPLFAVRPESIGLIRDKLLLDEVVAQANGKIADEHWKRMLPLASGWSGFNRIAEIENQLYPADLHQLLHGRESARLAPVLFPHRGDPDRCKRLLREAVRDPDRQICALWTLSEANLLDEVVTPEMVLDHLPTLKEVGFEGRERVQFLLGLANKVAGQPAFSAAVVARVLAASARGVPWGYLWWEIPSALRDDVGLASIDTDRPAPWAESSIRRRLLGDAAWDRLLDLVERPPTSLAELEAFYHGVGLWTGTVAPRELDGQSEFMPQRDGSWLLKDPLPTEPSEAFEARLVAALRRLRVGELTVAKRLSEFPLTKERANRIVNLTLESGEFYFLDRCEEIALAAGAHAGEVTRPRRMEPRDLRAYARLAGGASALTAWLDEAVGAGDLWTALALYDHHTSVQTPQRTAVLRELALRQRLPLLLAVHKRNTGILSEEDIVRCFTDTPHSDGEWERLSAVPQFLAPVLEAKTVSTTSSHLAERLLEQLERMDVGARRLAALAVDRVVTHGADALPAYRVAKLLGSGKLWAEQGKRLLEHFIHRDGGRGVTMWLATAVNKPDLAKTIHAVLAEVIIDATERALKRGDNLLATRLLRGLAELVAPPRLFRRVRALRELPHDDAILVLIEGNEGLLVKDDGEVPKIERAHAALGICADFAGDADQWRPS